jgi:Thymidylate kinase
VNDKLSAKWHDKLSRQHAGQFAGARHKGSCEATIIKFARCLAESSEGHGTGLVKRQISSGIAELETMMMVVPVRFCQWIPPIHPSTHQFQYSMARGPFIVIEGLDRSGKTTQTDLLAARLFTAGVTLLRRKFPGE